MERGVVSGFLLRGVFEAEGLEEVVIGFEEFCSSEDSENTGVPCLKEGSSESEPERLEEEEEISSITRAEGLEDLGVDLKAILADLREGLEGGEEEGVREGRDLGGGRDLGVRVRLATIFTFFLFSPV